jgi:hypothetical protein
MCIFEIISRAGRITVGGMQGKRRAQSYTTLAPTGKYGGDEGVTNEAGARIQRPTP